MKNLFMAAILSITTLMPFDMNAGSSGRRTVHLTGKNTLILAGVIDPVSIDTFMAAMMGKRMLLDPNETMYIIIGSEGGVGSSADILQVVMNQMPNTKLICKYCYSAAGMIFATSELPRLVLDDSQLLMHEMYCNHVTADLLRSHLLDPMLTESDEFNAKIAKVLRMSVEDYADKIRNTQWTLTGRDIIRHHAGDEMIYVDCDGYVNKLAPGTCSE